MTTHTHTHSYIHLMLIGMSTRCWLQLLRKSERNINKEKKTEEKREAEDAIHILN